ncbi:hypothetical protein [Acuticoccus yangtzensis]|uniref:hypothetical protein n=1 Tax=Acuticoccus yangtzensis TaxID=1443441 RepID=UPI0009497D5F|nr:hypothetical protein [Acuticoccus yangtzensis]
MRLPGRAELADGLVGAALSFSGGVVAGAIAYVVAFRGADVGVWTLALGFGVVLALFGFVAEFVRCWIAGPRFGPVVAALGRALRGDTAGGPAGPTSRSQRMMLAAATAMVVVMAIWGIGAVTG